MSTTAVFAELLVGGLQTLAWLGLVVMLILGPSSFQSVTKAPYLSVIGIVAIAYPVGVLFDRVWDLLLKRLGIEGWLEDVTKESARAELSEQKDEFFQTRIKILRSDPKIAVDVIHYNRSRMRVARASMFNMLLITVTAFVAAVVHFPHTRVIVLIGVIGGLVFSVSGVAYYDLKKSYYVFLGLLSLGETQRKMIDKNSLESDRVGGTR